MSNHTSKSYKGNIIIDIYRLLLSIVNTNPDTISSQFYVLRGEFVLWVEFGPRVNYGFHLYKRKNRKIEALSVIFYYKHIFSKESLRIKIINVADNVLYILNDIHKQQMPSEHNIAFFSFNFTVVIFIV